MTAQGSLPLDLDLAAELTAALDEPFAARRVRRFENVSADVFEIAGDRGRAVILKVYADEPAWKLRKEAFVAGRFGSVADVPRWLAVDETRARLPRRFAVMTRLPGASLRDSFGREGSHALFREMGALLRRLHAVAMPRHGYLLEADVAEPFDANATRMAAAFEAKFRDFRGWGGDPALCGRIERFVAARADALAECDGAVLCHNDFHPGNVLADRPASAGRRLAAVGRHRLRERRGRRSAVRSRQGARLHRPRMPGWPRAAGRGLRSAGAAGRGRRRSRPTGSTTSSNCSTGSRPPAKAASGGPPRCSPSSTR